MRNSRPKNTQQLKTPSKQQKYKTLHKNLSVGFDEFVNYTIKFILSPSFFSHFIIVLFDFYLLLLFSESFIAREFVFCIYTKTSKIWTRKYLMWTTCYLCAFICKSIGCFDDHVLVIRYYSEQYILQCDFILKFATII